MTDLPKEYTSALHKLRQAAPTCLSNENSRSFQMIDGSFRQTFASLSEDPTPFPECLGNTGSVISRTFDRINKLMSNLITQIAGHENVKWLDDNSENPKSLFDATHKDHVHVYKQKGHRKKGQDSKSDFLLPFHVDNGLYLLLTPSSEHPLLVKDRSREEISTKGVGDDSILVLMARGLKDWLLQESPIAEKFHAVPHAVLSMANNPGLSHRTVYARMEVVPLGAVPYHRRAKRDATTFGDVFHDQNATETDHSQHNQNGGHSQTTTATTTSLDPLQKNETQAPSDLQALNDFLCESGTAYCWMSCLSLPSACPNVDDAMCYSTQRNIYCSTDPDDDTVHDESCQWECKPDEVPVEDPDRFCTGAISMYMTGFQTSGNKKKPCVILLFEPWVLDSKGKIAGACIGTILFGMFIELVVFTRRQIHGKKPGFAIENAILYKVVLIFAFAINIGCGYLAMLIAMTYSVELFVSIILGLAIGYAIFNLKAPVGEAADPCCVNQNDAKQDYKAYNNDACHCE